MPVPHSNDRRHVEHYTHAANLQNCLWDGGGDALGKFSNIMALDDDQEQFLAMLRCEPDLLTIADVGNMVTPAVNNLSGAIN